MYLVYSSRRDNLADWPMRKNATSLCLFQEIE
jgi:hypothetical protein